MQSSMDLIQKNFGFGFMRLPMKGEEVDVEQTSAMVDYFLENGFQYFDTAHGYLNGKSELAIRECLTSRYPRDRYILTNKLSIHYFQKEEDIRPLFQQQLEACGVEYFDFYLMHAMSAARIGHFEETRAFETVLELKKEGKVRHLGMSFHDSAEVLDQILSKHFKYTHRLLLSGGASSVNLIYKIIYHLNAHVNNFYSLLLEFFQMPIFSASLISWSRKSG